MVRCHLEPGDDPARTLRFIPLGEFELWRFLMETRHKRSIRVEDVSFWVPEDASLLRLHRRPGGRARPVLRIRFEARSAYGVPIPVDRFLPAETYPEAQAALLSHFESAYRGRDRHRRLLRAPRAASPRRASVLSADVTDQHWGSLPQTPTGRRRDARRRPPGRCHR